MYRFGSYFDFSNFDLQELRH